MTRALPLIRIWLMLMALTLAAMLIGHVGASTRLKGYETAALLLLSGFKAALVLRHYLELKPGTAWHSALVWSIALLLAALSGMFLLA